MQTARDAAALVGNSWGKGCAILPALPVEFEYEPLYAVGILSLLVVAVAIVALYIGHLARAWRWIYVVTAVVALYFNVFVLIAQSLENIPALTA